MLEDSSSVLREHHHDVAIGRKVVFIEGLELFEWPLFA